MAVSRFPPGLIGLKYHFNDLNRDIVNKTSVAEAIWCLVFLTFLVENLVNYSSSFYAVML